MGTKKNPGKYDCYEKAGDDEPIFILRANDELAAGLVRDWAENYRMIEQGQGDMGNMDWGKYAEAQMCADAMELWRKGGEEKES